jgi:solute carrier family 13 (sodium-dependent dicarboxylate transporter), member 2/3/5
MLIVMFYFMIPAKPLQMSDSKPLLDWKTIQTKVPWGVFLLLGGGFAMAEGSRQSGLTEGVGDVLDDSLGDVSPLVLMIVVSLIGLALTEVMSNAVTCTMLLPVAEQLAVVVDTNPIKLMLPLTICASYAFMYPAGCASNAIIYEAAKFKVSQMAIPGFVCKIICLIVVIALVNSWGPIVFDFSWDSVVNETTNGSNLIKA